MHSHVTVKEGGMRECFPTHRTLKWLLFSVGLHMNIKVEKISKTFSNFLHLQDSFTMWVWTCTTQLVEWVKALLQYFRLHSSSLVEFSCGPESVPDWQRLSHRHGTQRICLGCTFYGRQHLEPDWNLFHTNCTQNCSLSFEYSFVVKDMSVTEDLSTLIAKFPPCSYFPVNKEMNNG